ncbi:MULTISPECIES: 2-oxo acid dehydrogenase subunit E2 [Paenarthrobacter]|uniref:Dihydrolipoamide acetyltransferase component of pyruvate dehydrogenase complex n=1 Tax=Paenarthrobacter ureafaciens TaxID=37931 RepID=A0AAX3EQ89_PAEUR|nr:MULTISPECIES: 2-oxo acid dehydrogenase subunit E2 [Paenarthrobacter]NKR12665.1 hypothetical protein [Arthrobacter sp. M5]NKR16490.1 hypothetical protein [Arthrobacter sp. M6]OEH60086.1 hypothetical protein A5N17_17275 [Arthrobacter sp. D2]OEH63722.1 hypothetical protein A5N13_13920 [Arthrobacter sp. D4]MDO5878289.1 2-oxo acid dehydrogenase subunit E2 [Paenarthrobacter sp. SD-1]
MAPTIITMPAVVADATEAVLQAWLVAEGDTITAGTPIADIETEKATVELEAETDGTVGRFIISAGAHVSVGEPVAVLLGDDEGPADLDAALAEIGGQAAGDAATASSEGGTPATDQGTSIAPAHSSPKAGANERKFTSPLARKLAREAGIVLEGVEGTGPGGRIVRADIVRAIAARGASAADAFALPRTSAEPLTETDAVERLAVPAGVVDTPMSPMRRAIARRLTESKTQVPHFYVTRSVEMDELLALRIKINASVDESDRRISVNDLIIKAVALALKDVPAANSIVVGDTIRRFEAADIAVAIAIPDGLLTPVVRGADTIGIGAISRQIGDFAARARSGKIKQHELEGGAFTVSNLGMYGVDDFAAILNPPQSGILAISAAQQHPVVRDGELAVATVMNCTLSADHRVIDGAVAAEFMTAFVRRIETPMTLLVS